MKLILAVLACVLVAQAEPPLGVPFLKYGPPVRTTPKPTLKPYKPAIIYGPPTTKVIPTPPKPTLPPYKPAIVYGPPITKVPAPPKPTLPPYKPAIIYGPPTTKVPAPPKPTLPPYKPAIIYGPPTTKVPAPPKPTLPPYKPAIIYGPPTTKVPAPPKPTLPPYKPAIIYGPPTTKVPAPPKPTLPPYKPAIIYGPPTTKVPAPPKPTLPPYKPAPVKPHTVYGPPATKPSVSQVTTVVQLPAASGEKYFPAATIGFNKPPADLPELLPASKKVQIVVKPGVAQYVPPQPAVVKPSTVYVVAQPESGYISKPPSVSTLETVVQLPVASGENYFPASTDGFTHPLAQVPELLPASKKIQYDVKPGLAGGFHHGAIPVNHYEIPTGVKVVPAVPESKKVYTTVSQPSIPAGNAFAPAGTALRNPTHNVPALVRPSHKPYPSEVKPVTYPYAPAPTTKTTYPYPPVVTVKPTPKTTFPYPPVVTVKPTPKTTFPYPPVVTVKPTPKVTYPYPPVVTVKPTPKITYPYPPAPTTKVVTYPPPKPPTLNPKPY